jgi:hypothetical protein
MVPLALAEARCSDSKCLILGEACMQVLDMLKEYKDTRAIFVAVLNEKLKKEMQKS